jgi:hypothetical protein
MRETCLPTRTKLQGSSPVLALLLIGVTLGGCSGGDFGRTRQDFLNDDLDRRRGDRKCRAAAVAIPAYR